ncbi:IS110 family transposase [Pelagibius sp. Alg239-R121]|uniref:IS110 family transposase n=1 Tax=Pelagibius sp. Alg239-R121 TaxID=2993448 RepID=UPI0024A75BE9|nr:IS110 family transposase [Pelagibius sp. Alg239-R121]
MQINRIGLDLAKYVFEVHAVDDDDRVVLRKTLRRDSVAQFFAELESCIVGMEACCGSHYWARVLTDLGHEVRLISPQFVKPYVKSNKNDRNDAEAICEAVGRPSMRFVSPKSPEQLEIQAVHRIRQRVVANRTRLVNQVRGLLGEHGIVAARDITRIRRTLNEITDGQSGDLGELFIEMLRDMREELAELDTRLAGYNRRIRDLFRSNEMCQRIGQIEGIGPITATALVAAVGNQSCFKNGRQFAAWLGLVPKQHSSGGKARLFGISKRSDRYLRTMLIHGARAVLGRAAGKTDLRSQWINRMRKRRHPNVVAVALANKNARIVWSLLSREQEYRSDHTVAYG